MDNQLCGSDVCMSSGVCICVCDPNNQGTFFHDHFFMPPNNYFSQPPKSMEEMKQALVDTHMELEATKKRADLELRNRDNQLTHLKFLLSQAKQQTDQSQINFKTLISQLITLQNKLHQLQHIHNNPTHPLSPPLPPGIGFDFDNASDTDKLLFQCQTSSPPPPPLLLPISTVEDYNNNNNGLVSFSSSDSDESIVSSPVIPQPPPTQDPTIQLLVDKPLPEKGKLLMAVMKAGPLLQTLLLAGPLPQWRHPPPPLDSYQIPPPPVVIPQDQHLAGTGSNSDHNDCVKMMRKRDHLCGGGGGGGPDHFTLLQVQINKRPRVVA